MNAKLFDALEDAVKTKYAGPSALNFESLLLNVIMLQVVLCYFHSHLFFLFFISFIFIFILFFFIFFYFLKFFYRNMYLFHKLVKNCKR